MVDLTGDISRLLFRQVLKNNAGEISIDGQLLGVFLQLDGKKEVGTVARTAGLKLPEMRQVIAKLLDMRLIEPAGVLETPVDQDFLEFLNRQLAEAVGPIAGVLVEDYVAEAGFQSAQFPASQAASLVDALAREIQREEKMKVFKVNMTNKLKEKGY